MSEALLSEKPVLEADTAPSAAEAAGAPAQAEAARHREPRERGRVGLALWLLLLTAALAGGGDYLWRQLQQTRQALAAEQQAVNRKLDTAQQRLDALQGLAQRVAGQDSALAAMQSRQQALEESLGKLRSDLTGSARLWDVQQIAVLLQIANDRLRLEADVGPSLAALQAADRNLQQLKNTALLEVRRRLAREINALESVPTPDVPGMALKLEALINGVDHLPLATGEDVSTAAPPATRPEGWRGVLHDLWENIKSLVVIKHRGGADRPLLAPDERYFLRQNLRLELETARLALLRRDNESYQDSLHQARDWIGHYFDEQAAATAAARQELAGLQQADIAPPLPDISGSLTTLQEWLAKQQQPAAKAGP